MPYVTSNGAHIHYETSGNGAPLLLLHGNGEDHSVFANQIEFFAPHFRVIAIDSRGHGQSTAGGVTTLNYELLADDIENLLNDLQIAHFRIVGFSDGGIVALLLAQRMPERIMQIVAIGANYRPSGLKFSIRLAVAGCYAAYSLRYALSRFDAKWRWKRQLMQLMLCHPHIAESALQSINTPALIVAGDRDMIRFRHTCRLASLLPNSRLAILPNCNHFVLQQQPDALNQLAMNFFS